MTVTINNLRKSAMQSEEIIFILRHQVLFLLKRHTSERTPPRTCAFITLRDDRHAWTDRNYLTGIGRQWVRNKFYKVVLHKVTPKLHKNV